jgi:hypothetical protein
MALALGLATPATSAGTPSGRSARDLMYTKNKSFKIPFNVDPSERARLKQVQLWVSENSGFNWKEGTHTTPDRPYFTFRAPRDGEYWFAVRTLDNQGKLYPSDDEEVRPSMKVIVDSKVPSLVLEPDGRRGSQTSVRWEIHDENLDPNSLVIEYQVEGANKWGRVRIDKRPAPLIGSVHWDAQTAEPLVVRALVEDWALNRTEATIETAEGTPNRDDFVTGDMGNASDPPPPMRQIAAGPDFTPVGDPPGSDSQENFPPPASNRNDPDPFLASDNAESKQASRAEKPPNRNASLLVGSPQFPLQYAVDDAGPDGPNTVELWVTSNGGRTWNRRGEDPDRVSPFLVDLGGEGTYGLCLVARSASGLGDQPPAPGDPPQIWVEVDNTPPSVVLNPPAVGTGKNAGKVSITWGAKDFHLAPLPVVLLWRPDQAGAQWQKITGPVANTGRYVWSVPADAPPRLHIRIEVIDTVGNRGTAETTETGHVIVDRTRPRSRIIGLDPSARTGDGPAARPLR